MARELRGAQLASKANIRDPSLRSDAEPLNNLSRQDPF